MKLHKLGALVVVAFVLFYAITNPNDAATAVRTVAAGLATFATALATGGN